MKPEILERIQALGGQTTNVKGQSLAADLLAITFASPLYPKPENTPWASADSTEPIYGVGSVYFASVLL